MRLPVDKPWDVVSVTRRSRSSGSGVARRPGLCARVRACAGAAESRIFTYIHTTYGQKHSARGLGMGRNLLPGAPRKNAEYKNHALKKKPNPVILNLGVCRYLRFTPKLRPFPQWSTRELGCSVVNSLCSIGGCYMRHYMLHYMLQNLGPSLLG